MAKLHPDRLAGALQQQLAPAYLICGEEPLLIQEACDSVRRAAKAAGFSEHERYYNETGFDWEQLLTSANSLSLFAERKLLEIRIDNGKPGDKGGKALETYCSNPSPDNLLLVVCPAKPDQRSKWYKALEQIGAVVQVWPVVGAQLPRWIEQRIHHAGLKAEPQAVELLASLLEGNLLAAMQEIEKLKLLCSNGIITASAVAGAVADSARYNVFSLTDKALHGDARSAVKTLHGLRGEGTEPLAILGVLTREIRSLATIAYATNQGQNFDWACKNAGVWDTRKPLIKSALHRLKLPHLLLLLRKANGIDKAVKGMRDADPWDELLDLTLNMAGTVSLSPALQNLSLKL